MPYEVTHTLQDAASQQTTITTPLGQFGWVEGDPLEFSLVWNAANNVRGSLEDVTQANVVRQTISYVRALAGGDGLGDIADEVFVSARLDTANPAYVGVRIPAPIPALIQPDGVGVVATNPLYVAYLQRLQDHGRFGAGMNVEIVDPVETLTPFIRSKKRRRK